MRNKRGCSLLDICIIAFPTSVTNSLTRYSLVKGGFSSNSWFDGAVLHGGECITAGEEVLWMRDTEAAGSLLIAEDQEAEGREWD